jgi:hypothetical protein
MADELLEIADDSSKDKYSIEIGEGVEIEKTDHEVIQRSRLRVDTRKWLMSKMLPKKYGDRIQQELTGPNGAALIPVINLTVERKESE